MDQPSEPKQTTERTSPGFPAWLIWLLLSLPLLYVLSIGPAARLITTGAIPLHTFEAFYGPVFVLAHYVPPFKSSLIWYISLCAPNLWLH